LKVEKEDERKLKLMGNSMGIKVPWVIPSQLIDPKAPLDPNCKTLQNNQESYGIDAPDLT